MILKSYNRKTPKFCHQCGLTLVQKTHSVGFNTSTGEQKEHYSLKCPKAWGLAGNNYTNHAWYEFDENGDEIINYDY